MFIAVRGPSLVVASGGFSSLSTGFSLVVASLVAEHRLQQVEHVGSGAAQGLGCSVASGIFRDQGSSPCPLNWQGDSYPLYHQGSPTEIIYLINISKPQPNKIWNIMDVIWISDNECTSIIDYGTDP